MCTPIELQLEMNLLQGRNSPRKAHIGTKHDSEAHNSLKYVFIYLYLSWNGSSGSYNFFGCTKYSFRQIFQRCPLVLLGAPANCGFNFSLLLKKENLNSAFDQLSLKSWPLILAINSSKSHLTLNNVENSPSMGTAQHVKEATQ